MTINLWLMSFLAGVAGGCFGYVLMEQFTGWAIRRHARRAQHYQHRQVQELYRQSQHNNPLHVPRVPARKTPYQWNPQRFDGIGSVDE